MREKFASSRYATEERSIRDNLERSRLRALDRTQSEVTLSASIEEEHGRSIRQPGS